MSSCGPHSKILILFSFRNLIYFCLLFFCRPKIAFIDDTTIKVRIKLRRRVKNHLGSMYLGALTVGADITAGYFAFHFLRMYKKNISLIFKDFHADFYKRSTGDVEFICTMGSEIKGMIEESISTSSRVNLPVTVNASVPSISDEIVAKFILTLSVKVK